MSPPARYEVRAKRLNDSGTTTRESDKAMWTGLRAFRNEVQSWPGVTMLAIKARASNQLNSTTQNRIAVIAQRVLYERNTTVWWLPPWVEISSRHPVDALIDIIRQPYLLNLSEDAIDFENLQMVKAETPAATFDYTFSAQTNAWEALNLIAASMQARCVLNGSKIGLVRDIPRDYPSQLITKELIQGEFSLDYSLRSSDEYSGLEVHYEDFTTHQQDTLTVYHETDTPNSGPLQTVRLNGVSDRLTAYRHGMRIRAAQKLQRAVISFQSSATSLVAGIGDLISVAHDLTNDVETGLIAYSDLNTVTVREPLKLQGEASLTVRRKDGKELGPFEVNILDPHTLQFTAAKPTPGQWDQTELETTPHHLLFTHGL